MKQFKIVVERHSDGYVAYPLGMMGAGTFKQSGDVARLDFGGADVPQ